MTREELRDGYLRVLTAQYDPDRYFERTEALFLNPNFEIGSMRSKYWRKHPFRQAQVRGRAPRSDDRTLFPSSQRDSRETPAAGIQEAILAVPEGQAPTRARILLSVPHRDALPRLHHVPRHDLKAHGDLQLLLIA